MKVNSVFVLTWFNRSTYVKLVKFKKVFVDFVSGTHPIFEIKIPFIVTLSRVLIHFFNVL